MADLSCEIAGIHSINPFWLASAPPTDKQINVERAFRAGWGGAVWKTLGLDPPVVNATSRYGVHRAMNRQVLGINNIELISDRPLDVNLREIEAVRRNWPDRVIIGSIMAVMEENAWKDLAIRVANAGVHGLELNFGCPHGMCERGMGSAIGQAPELVAKATRWVVDATGLPVFAKLTPNVTDILIPAEAALEGGAHAVSLINTVNSITSVDLDSMAPTPIVDGFGTHGGYCGEAVKPIALNMVANIGRNAATRDLAISAIGGITTWRDAAEFIALGARSLQVCTAAMLYGFRIVDDMKDGLLRFMDEKQYRYLSDFRGRALGQVVDWNDLNLNHDLKAFIRDDLCIDCGRCHIVCEDTSHQAIRIEAKAADGRRFVVVDDECVGCNLCQIVCPIPDCIDMVQIKDDRPKLTWPDHPLNPANSAH